MIFICQSVDEQDKLCATTLAWIRSFDTYFNGKVDVITLRYGINSLPKNVSIHHLTGQNKIIKALNFIKLVIKIKPKNEFVFIYQGGYYPLILWPFKYIYRIKLFQWKAHTSLSFSTFINFLFAEKVFTSTPSAFPIKSNRVYPIGQSVDTELFKPIKGTKKNYDILVIGRINEIKRIDIALEIIASLKQLTNINLSIAIIGEFDCSNGYKKYIINKIDKIIEKQQFKVEIINGVVQSKLNEYYNQANCIINVSNGALDRTIVESMACNIPTFSDNKCYSEILSENLKNIYYDDDTCNLSRKIARYLKGENIQSIVTLRDIVLERHNINNVANRIFHE
jgi:glycosyltransferase involved in cell wall biosynthesis